MKMLLLRAVLAAATGFLIGMGLCAAFGETPAEKFAHATGHR